MDGENNPHLQPTIIAQYHDPSASNVLEEGLCHVWLEGADAIEKLGG